jgi:hypothetical protein
MSPTQQGYSSFSSSSSFAQSLSKRLKKKKKRNSIRQHIQYPLLTLKAEDEVKGKEDQRLFQENQIKTT